MTIFSKLKRSKRTEPMVCDRFRTRPADVHIRSVVSAGPRVADSRRVADWWLCSACAAALRPEDPGNS